MWAKYDVLRRPEIAYLMCQFGDRSGVEAVTRAFFADNYDTGRRLEPDGAAAGTNATDDAFRILILYGTLQHHQKLLGFLRLSDDPLRKRDSLCANLLGLSSIDKGPGLPVGYPREQFPFELAIACLDYTEEVGTIVAAPGGTADVQASSQQGSITVSGTVGVYPQRGCEHRTGLEPTSSGNTDSPIAQNAEVTCQHWTADLRLVHDLCPRADRSTCRNL